MTSADDAFGTTVGNERTGIYSESDVRGFSPVRAGNLRIEGIYYDQQGAPTSRMRTSAAIRVGITALDYPFPAPTGIVDFHLRPSGDDFVVSVGVAARDYGGNFAEVDAQIPVIPGRLSVAAGASLYNEEYSEGANGRFVSLAAVPRLRWSDGEIMPLASLIRVSDLEARPVVSTTGPFLPPIVRSRTYYGQDWADNSMDTTNFGGVGRIKFSDALSLRFGAFNSQVSRHHGYAQLFTNVQPDGSARRMVIADPKQLAWSNSGEVRLTWSRSGGALSHRVHLAARGHDKLATSGGFSIRDLGPGILGVPDPEPVPEFSFGGLNKTHIRQLTGGLAYMGKWAKVAELNVGLQKTDYRSTFTLASGAKTGTRDRPWLYNATLALLPRNWLAIYGGYARGLEESGTAPENATNRNEILPAARTRQLEIGMRVKFGKLRLIAGLFDISRPYHSFDANNVFTEQGSVRHRGVEISVAGPLSDRLSLIAGAVLMKPRVAGEARDRNLVGERPVGSADTFVRVDLDYRVPAIAGLSLSAAVVHSGERVASAQTFAALGGEQLTVPALTTFDLGVRYLFKIGGTPASFRVALGNVTDARYWRVLASNSFQAGETRRLSIYLAADL